MRPAIDAVAGTGTGGRRGRALLHRRPVRPGRDSSTPWTTTCGWPSRSSTPARTCWRSRTWPGCCGRRRRRTLVTRAARAVRPAGAPAHPRHRRRSARHAIWRRRRPGSTPSTAAVAAMAGTTSQPSLSALVAATDHTDRATGLIAARRSRTSSRTGRPCARCTRRSSPGCRPRPGGSTTTRSPAGSCPTCGSRPSRWAWATGSSRSRTTTPRPTGCWAGWSRSPRRRRSSATSRCTWSAPASTPKDFEADPGRYDIPDSVIGFLRGELGDPPGGWPEPFRTKALRRPADAEGGDRAVRRGRAGLHGGADERRGDAEPAAVPRPDQGVPRAPRDLRRHTACCRPTSSSTACGRDDRAHTSSWSRGVTLLIGLEAISEPDERGMRTVHAHAQRATAPGTVRDRSVASGRQGRGEGRPGQPRPHRRPVRRRGHPQAVTEGDKVAGRRRPSATIEAMKMEASITAPRRAAPSTGSRSARSSRSRAATSCSSSPRINARTQLPWPAHGPTCHGPANRARRGWDSRAVSRAGRGAPTRCRPRGTRPTSDRVREALFSAVGARPGLDGARVLDLYAGSGALGLEALSRGAAHALFVESNRRAATVLRGNVTDLGLPGAQVRAGAGRRGAGAGRRSGLRRRLRRPALRLRRGGRRLAGRTHRARLAGRRRVVAVERAAAARAFPWPPGYEAEPRARSYGEDPDRRRPRYDGPATRLIRSQHDRRRVPGSFDPSPTAISTSSAGRPRSSTRSSSR